MGRILRKKRVGKEETENILVGKSNVLEVKNPKVLSTSKVNSLPLDAATHSSSKSQKRTVLMDKTNALKPRNAKPKLGATAPKVKDIKKSSQKPKGAEENLGMVTRRRQSSKENDGEPAKSPQDETESRPLGDKTNVPSPKKKLVEGAVTCEISADKDITKASNKESISSDEDNLPKVRKLPPRNAAKFEDGWISALWSSRTSKESDRESQKSHSPKSKSKPLIPEHIDKTSSPEKKKRACRGANDANTGEEVRDGIKPEKKFTSTPDDAAKQRVGQFSRSEQQKSSRISSESDSNSQASHDEEVTNQQLVPNESPVRKLPPRNASKYEKGWISSLRRSRNSKEKDCVTLKSPQKIEPKPLDERTNAEKEVGKADSGEGVRKRKENKSLHSSKKIAEEITAKSGESDEEKDLVPELQKAPKRPLGRPKNRPGSSAQIETVKEKDVEIPKKRGETESRTPGLKNFESRIAAKLGIDMSGSVSITKTKDSDKNPKKPCAKETSLRRVRKRGVDGQIKTYAEAEGSEEEVAERSPSHQGSKTSVKSSVKPLTVSHKAKISELKDIKDDSSLTTAVGEEATSAIVNPKEKESGPSSCGNLTVHEPKPGCSRDSEFTTPLRRNSASKDVTNNSPLVPPSSCLFSIFKKPETPRRNSFENKIFVSGVKPCPAEDANKKQLPIYGNPNMTPLKRTSALAQEKKEELYDFEVDENEPKPKKRHKPIMKIQRVRAVKRKKPKVYEADPETERRVLKNLDLSPSVFEEFRSAKKKKIENAAGVIAAQPSQSPHPAEAAETDDHPPDNEAPNCHDLHFDDAPMSSPCRDYGQSTPLRTDAPSMFLDDSRDKFGRLSAKIYSPVKSKDSPIPVLMAEYNNDPVRGTHSTRRSAASTASCASGSGNSSYQNDLDVSASTPVKFIGNDSTTCERERRQPLELNISNCFGFDEPEIMEEPLVSPIKSTSHAPVYQAPAKLVPILKSKPPVMLPPPETPAIDVGQVIKQLRFEVGESSSANNSLDVSVYDDSEISLKNKSPIKRYLQPKDEHKHKGKKAADESTVDGGNESFSPILPVAPKVPRLSYERLNKLRNKKVLESVYKEASESESAEDSEMSDVEQEPEPREHIFEPTKNKYKVKKPKKKEKGMTKKEEEGLEKWAQMFNSQCDQVDSFGLVVE